MSANESTIIQIASFVMEDFEQIVYRVSKLVNPES